MQQRKGCRLQSGKSQNTNYLERWTKESYDQKMQKGMFEKLLNRVARWFLPKPKIPIWVNLEGLRLEK
jgi:hypothetical protein